ncbi:MAG: O-antigen ligase family protein [Anaerolineae bacterium]
MGTRTESLEDRLRADGKAYWATVAALCLILAGLSTAAILLFDPPIVLGLVLGGLVALVILRSTGAGLVALMAVAILLPFGAIPVNLGFFPTFLDLALVGFLLVWVVRLATRTQERWRGSALDVPIALFLLLTLASFLAGTGHAELDKEIIRHYVEVVLAIVLYYAVINTVVRASSLRRAIRVLILLGFAEAALGVVLYLLPRSATVGILSSLAVFHYPSGPGVLRFIEDNPLLSLRAVGSAIDPNVLGGMLILVGGVAGAQVLARQPLLPRWASWPILGILGLAMLLTFSRGALAGLVVAWGFLGIVRYRRLLPILAGTALLLLLLPQTQGYVSHFLEGVRGEDLATQMRFGEYKDALILIRRFPLFGVGFGGAPSIDLYIGVSSVYLLMAENMGLVGLGTFLLIMGVFFQNTWQARRRMGVGSEGEAILLGLQASVLGALTGGVFDHYFFNLDFPHSVVLFWMVVGLAIATVRVHGEGRLEASGPRIRRFSQG